MCLYGLRTKVGHTKVKNKYKQHCNSNSIKQENISFHKNIFLKEVYFYSENIQPNEKPFNLLIHHFRLYNILLEVFIANRK